MPTFTPEELEIIAADPALSDWFALQTADSESAGWCNFRPRPDRPELLDQQWSFVYNRDPMAFFLKGNAAGGTEAAAFKTALFVLQQQPPPRKNAPFWIISDTYKQVMGTCWVEKLAGHGHIPACEVRWEGIRWHDTELGYPYSVPLKPWPTERGGDPNKNWLLEFKSFEQGRAAMQARSIGGFWFCELFPHELLIEVFRGCRDYMFPGGQFAEFTPTEPSLCAWVEDCMNDPPPGWKFYRGNTTLNRPNLAPGWYEQYVATVPDEMLATRLTGALANYEGIIYQSFNSAIHVVDRPCPAWPTWPMPPHACWHRRGIDWGASAEHPFVCVWVCRDGAGNWFLYDEYWSPDQTMILEDHIGEIRERSWGWGWPRPGFHNALYGDTYADPSRPGDIAECNRRGIQCVPASNDVYLGIDYVRSLFKVQQNTGLPRLFISAKCVKTIEEHRKYRWKKRRPASAGALLTPEVAKPVPLKKDDDTCDALRYVLFSDYRQGNLVPSSTQRKEAAVRKSLRGVYVPRARE